MPCLPLTSPLPQPKRYHSYCLHYRYPVPSWAQKILWVNLSKIICTFSGIRNDLPLKAWRLSQRNTSFSCYIYFYLVYWSMSMADTWLRTLWLICQMVPAAMLFPTLPWQSAEAQGERGWRGAGLHSSWSVLKSWEFKMFLVMYMVTDVEISCKRVSFWEGESFNYSKTLLVYAQVFKKGDIFWGRRRMGEKSKLVEELFKIIFWTLYSKSHSA